MKFRHLRPSFLLMEFFPQNKINSIFKNYHAWSLKFLFQVLNHTFHDFLLLWWLFLRVSFFFAIFFIMYIWKLLHLLQSQEDHSFPFFPNLLLFTLEFFWVSLLFRFYLCWHFQNRKISCILGNDDFNFW